MSASREKKTRQGMVGQELTEKQLQAQKEAAQAKRNTVVYTIIGVVCAVLVAALLIWNSGFFQSRAAAVNIGGEDYSVGEVQYYYNKTLNNYYAYSQMYAQYGLDMGVDLSKDLAEQMYDAESGITWYDQILDEAITNMTQTKMLVAEAETAGVTLSEEGAHEIEHAMQDMVTSSANQGFTTVTSYLKAAFGNAMTKSKYVKFLEEEQLAYEYQQAYAEGLTYTEEELQEYYENHKDSMDLFDFNYAFFAAEVPEKEYELPRDIEGEVDAETAIDTEVDVEATAEAALAEALKQAEALKTKLARVDFAAAVEQYSETEDVTVKEERGVSSSALNSVYAQWLREAGRKEGDVTVMVDSGETGYFVVEFVGRARSEEISGDVRHVLVAAEQDPEATEPTEEQYEAARVKAESLMEQWKNNDPSEESFAELAKAESVDPGSAENGGLYEQVSSASGFIPEFADWATDPARKVGEVGLVKNTGSSTKGWHIMYFVGQNSPVWQLEAEYALANEEGTAWLDSLVEDAHVVKLDALKNIK